MTTVSDRSAATDSAASTTAAPTDASTQRIDVPYLSELLLGRYPEQRRAGRRLGGDPRLAKIEGLTMDEQRARVLEQIRVLEQDGNVLRAFPTQFGGLGDSGGSSVVYEEITAACPALKVKAGVQWGLFSATIFHLGTPEQHEKWLRAATSVEVPGAFAMTEIGHGSDVASIGTTATYDEATQEFVVHTPFKAAWKEYLGNAGKHGTAATVFAQLITKGVNHGVHALYVPLRETNADGSAGDFKPGVGGEDDGLKGGLVGVDNGRLHFTNVRVPRENLLARHGHVAEDGTYSSPIDNPNRRFFTMLGALVQGRVTLDGASAVAAKLGLIIAVTYGNQRRQFAGADGSGEVVLLDYREHQRRLLPLVARAYAGHFAHESLLELLGTVFSGKADTDETRGDLETMSAALKPISTWRALETLQTAREACGGAGFITENRITSLRADMDIFATFEGDNTVLLQLVGKRLLTALATGTFTVGGVNSARIAIERAEDSSLYEVPLAELAERIAADGTGRSAGENITDTATQRELLSDRVETMLADLGAALQGGTSRAAAAEIFNDHQSDVVEVARAYADLLQWEAFTKALGTVEDAASRAVLTSVRDLFAFTTLERNLAWYVVKGRLSADGAGAVTTESRRLLVELRPHAQDLVDSFGYGPEHVRATIATGVEQERQDEARAYYRDLRASGNEPITEKALKARKA